MPRLSIPYYTAVTLGEVASELLKLKFKKLMITHQDVQRNGKKITYLLQTTSYLRSTPTLFLCSLQLADSVQAEPMPRSVCTGSWILLNLAFWIWGM